MTLFTILDIVIGLIFTFLILSLLATELQEELASIFEFRAKHLKRAIRALFDEHNVTADDYSRKWFIRGTGNQPIEHRSILIPLSILNQLTSNDVNIAWLDETRDRLITLKEAELSDPSADGSRTVNINSTAIKVVRKEIISPKFESHNLRMISHDLYNHSLIRDLNQQSTGIFGKLIRLRINTLINILRTRKYILHSEGPSNIDSKVFSTSILDVIQDNLGNHHKLNVEEDTVDSIRDKIYSLPYSDLTKNRLIEVLNRAELKILKDNPSPPLHVFRDELFAWYKHSIDTHTTGAYKRDSRFISILISILIVLTFNVNIFNIVEALQTREVRDALVSSAQNFIHENEKFVDACIKRNDNINTGNKESDNCANEIDSLSETLQANAPSMKIGWDDEDYIHVQIHDEIRSSNGLSIFGWLITALAVSMGSAFWFDILNRIVNFRYSSPNKE